MQEVESIREARHFEPVHNEQITDPMGGIKESSYAIYARGEEIISKLIGPVKCPFGMREKSFPKKNLLLPATSDAYSRGGALAFWPASEGEMRVTLCQTNCMSACMRK